MLADITDHAISFGLKVLLALLLYMLEAWIIRIMKRFLRKAFTKHGTEPAIVSFTMSLVSGTVQNVAGGIMILVFKPFKVGDYIEAQGFAGTVSEMNITATKLVTTDNRVIILPNGALSSGSVNNFSKMEWRRVDFKLGVEYGSDAAKVKELLISIAASDPRVAGIAKGAPANPFAAIVNLGDSSVDFTLGVWVHTPDYWSVFFDLNEKIYTELPKNGIGFQFPPAQCSHGEIAVPAAVTLTYPDNYMKIC